MTVTNITKTTGKTYTCAVCGGKSGESYQIINKAGNKSHRCSVCLTPAMREAYKAANPIMTECQTCGAGIKLSRDGWKLCEGCNKPITRCTCSA